MLRQVGRSVGILVAVVALSAPAGFAHTVQYVGGTGDVVHPVLLPPGSNPAGVSQVMKAGSSVIQPCVDVGPTTAVGGVCYPAGHVTPGSTNNAIITISDNWVNPVSALYCQDNNDDGFCGGASDHTEFFCNSVVLTKDDNWDTAVEVQVYFNGVVNGNPILSECGAMATVGEVAHNPDN